MDGNCWRGRMPGWLAVGLLNFSALLLNRAMSEQTRTLLDWLPAVVSVLVVWHLAAGLGL